MLTAVVILTGLLAVATLVPHVPVAHSLVRVWGFPRQQILAIAALVLLVSFFLAGSGWGWRGVQAALGVICLLQAIQIVPFTPLWRKESAEYDPSQPSGESVRLASSNVKMSNRDYGALVREMSASDPDIVILMEVDEAWAEGVASLVERYPHVVSHPLDNSYGMLLASRFELRERQVACLLTEDVPSIIATAVTPGGQAFRLYCIHPEPPVPHRFSTGRDGETALVALGTREETLPVLVTGDLNDVAWSITTKRFRRVSRLLDPRIGRRVFSTFDARYPLLRWPLDHLFHSAHFRVRNMTRLPPCGSDHFPVVFDLVLYPERDAESRPDAADGDDMERARELADDARERDEKPIGSDWEK